MIRLLVPVCLCLILVAGCHHENRHPSDRTQANPQKWIEAQTSGTTFHYTGFHPVGGYPTEFRPRHLCLDFADAWQTSTVFDDQLRNFVLADEPVYFDYLSHPLVFHYKNDEYSFPSKAIGSYPEITGAILVYVGADKHSIVSFNFATQELRTFNVPEHIYQLYGTSSIFTVGGELDSKQFEIYYVDPFEGVTSLGTVESRHSPIPQEIAVRDSTLYLMAGTRLYRISRDGFIELIDLSTQFTFKHDLSFAEIVLLDTECKYMLLNYLEDYCLVRLNDDSGEVIDTFKTAYPWSQSTRLFAFMDNELVTCVDNKIEKRDIINHVWELIADLPPYVTTPSTTVEFTEFPDTLAFHMLDACNGNLILVNRKAIVTYSISSGTFEHYVIIDRGDDILCRVSASGNRLIIGGEKGKNYVFQG